MDQQLEYGFTTAVFVLEYTADKLTAADADREFTEVTKENFWRMWPTVREWAEDLWRRPHLRWVTALLVVAGLAAVIHAAVALAG